LRTVAHAIRAAPATGVGRALGVGRFGAILGPFAAGTLMAAAIKLGHLFWLAIIPTLVCAIAVAALRLAVNRSGESPGSMLDTSPQA
jgi:MFS transporter, AAHS family, 4-hydroxybenzoate transporter